MAGEGFVEISWDGADVTMRSWEGTKNMQSDLGGINVLVYAAADALLHSQNCIKRVGEPGYDAVALAPKSEQTNPTSSIVPTLFFSTCKWPSYHTRTHPPLAEPLPSTSPPSAATSPEYPPYHPWYC